MTEENRLSRREALVLAGALGLYAVGCGGEDRPAASATATPTATPTTTAGGSEQASCVLTPEATEGPYYIDTNLIRRDVTEGRDGIPLDLRLTVQDADSCEPLEGATVEIWHCDALGEYSAGSETFMRGGQRTDASGAVAFGTVYPGWYQGRTTHIHVMVHAGGERVHTGQLYFDDEVTATVAGSEPYAQRGEPETTNASDGIYGGGGEDSTLELARRGGGYTGSLAMGVRA